MFWIFLDLSCGEGSFVVIPRQLLSGSCRNCGVVSILLLPFMLPLMERSLIGLRGVFVFSRLTRVCDGDGRRVVVANEVSDGGDDGQLDGAEGAEDDGPEVGWLLAGCPAAVANGPGPESGRCGGGHCWVL